MFLFDDDLVTDVLKDICNSNFAFATKTSTSQFLLLQSCLFCLDISILLLWSLYLSITILLSTNFALICLPDVLSRESNLRNSSVRLSVDFYQVIEIAPYVHSSSPHLSS